MLISELIQVATAVREGDCLSHPGEGEFVERT